MQSLETNSFSGLKMKLQYFQIQILTFAGNNKITYLNGFTIIKHPIHWSRRSIINMINSGGKKSEFQRQYKGHSIS